MAPCREDCSLVPDLFVLWLSPFLSLSKTIPEGVGKRAETDRHPGKRDCAFCCSGTDTKTFGNQKEWISVGLVCWFVNLDVCEISGCWWEEL